MIRKILVTTIVIFALFSCSVNDDSAKFSIETLPIKTAIVPDEFIFGEIYTINVSYDLPNSCHSFFDLFYRREGTSRIVAINSIVDNDLVCAEVLVEKQYSFSVEVLQRENYTFKFWKGTDNSGNDIFEEVIVPVIQ